MPESKRQVRAAHAVVEGQSHIMPEDVAQEIIGKMHGRKMSSLPEKANSGDAYRPRRKRRKA